MITVAGVCAGQVTELQFHIDPLCPRRCGPDYHVIAGVVSRANVGGGARVYVIIVGTLFCIVRLEKELYKCLGRGVQGALSRIDICRVSNLDGLAVGVRRGIALASEMGKHAAIVVYGMSTLFPAVPLRRPVNALCDILQALAVLAQERNMIVLLCNQVHQSALGVHYSGFTNLVASNVCKHLLGCVSANVLDLSVNENGHVCVHATRLNECEQVDLPSQ